MSMSRGLKQAYDVQNFAHSCLMAVQANLELPKQVTHDSNLDDPYAKQVRAPDKDTAAIIAQLGKVWKDGQEQVRVHRGTPLPGSLTHEKVRAVRGSRQRGIAGSALASIQEQGEQVATCMHGIQVGLVCVQCQQPV